MAVLVTGATSALGLQTALDLAAAGLEVVLHGRHAGALASAAARVAEVSGSTPRQVTADFAVLADVRALARRLEGPPLEGLVHCEETLEPERGETRDFHERTWQIGHLAPFLLTHLMLPALRAPGARVVFVAPLLPDTWIRLADLEMEEDWDAWEAYARVKLADVILAVELARRLGGGPPTVVAFDPGYARAPPPDPVVRPTRRAVRAAALDVIWLLTAGDVRYTSGRYYCDRREAEMAPIARDPALGRAIYEIGCDVLDLAPLPRAGPL